MNLHSNDKNLLICTSLRAFLVFDVDALYNELERLGNRDESEIGCSGNAGNCERLLVSSLEDIPFLFFSY